MNAIFTYIKNKSVLIDAVFNDLLGDLKSLRVWLILAAYAFNGVVLYMVGWRSVDYKLAGISIGLLTAVYMFFFASKSQQAQFENSQPTSVDDEPPADDRDPDKVDPNT